MTIKIHRLLKETLEKEDTINLSLSGMSNTSGMTISHYAYSLKQTEATIPYEIEIVSEHVPQISDIDFCLSIRTKIDLTAYGANGEVIKDIGSDVGEYHYVDKIPSRPTSLPPGFNEFYRE